jgi:hypothetical protein
MGCRRRFGHLSRYSIVFVSLSLGQGISEDTYNFTIDGANRDDGSIRITGPCWTALRERIEGRKSGEGSACQGRDHIPKLSVMKKENWQMP